MLFYQCTSGLTENVIAPCKENQVLPLIFHKLGKYVQGVSHVLRPLESRGYGGVRYALAMYIYIHQGALFICYKQSPEISRSVAFSQRANSQRLIEDDALNNCGIINNLKNYEDGREELDFLRADKIYAGIQLSNKLGKHFHKIDSNFERSMPFQKELRSRISGYRDSCMQMANALSSQKLITYFMVPKNKSI
ncbi:uncharacterized protein TNCV_2167051 [Trichonephila clavipes]|nr:uncharacterized protein TNCV_2167051 [Trichonephila clavipes]